MMPLSMTEILGNAVAFSQGAGWTMAVRNYSDVYSRPLEVSDPLPDRER
jgi:hypothetical protein